MPARTPFGATSGVGERRPISTLRRLARVHARELLGLGLVGLVLFGRFGRSAVTGMIAHQRDTGAFYYPLTAWFAQELQAGRFPLWCPLIFGGYPLVADGEIGMFYPLNVLALLVLPSDVAFVLVRTAHYFVAGLGTYALARVLGSGCLGASYAGLSFALGAFMVGHLDHGNILRSAAWLPGLLCCAELGLRARGRRVLVWIGLASAALALAGLGLHPQVLLIVLVSLWAYLPSRALALSIGRRRDPETTGGHTLLAVLVRCGVVLGTTTLLGLAGAAVQLAPTYELGTVSSRGPGLAYADATAGALSPFDLVTLILPRFFRADPRSVWSLYPYWETTLYVGLVGAVLAFVGLALGPIRTVLPIAGLALVGLALAMARYFPVDVYGWLWSLPGFESMRMPARYSLPIELGLAVLAGIGLDRLRGDAASRRTRRAIQAVGALGGLVISALVLTRLWTEFDEAGMLLMIRDGFLALPRDRPTLSAEQVRRGLLGALDIVNPWTGLALGAFLSTVALLWAWQRRPSGGRRPRGVLFLVAVAELLAVAHAFHPTAPIASLAEASQPMRFLSARDGPWRTFIAGRSDSAITSRPALFGVAQAYGYSSLPTARMERYWTRVNEVDDELLDLWNGRYILEAKPSAGRIQAEAVFFNPARPLLEGPAESPLGQEAYRVGPTTADAVRVLSATEGAAELPDGTAVAEVTLSGGDAPPETVTVRLGVHTAEAAYGDLGDAPAPWHTRAAVGYSWEPRDADGRVYRRDLYVADVALGARRIVERVEVRTLLPTGQLRLAGLALRDGATGKVDSLLRSHREKYALVYEDDRTAIYENRAALPRAFVVGESLTVEPDDWALVYLLQPGFDPRRRVLLERPEVDDSSVGGPLPASGLAAAWGARTDHLAQDARSARAPEPDGAVIVQYGTDHVVVRATSGRGGHLVLTDSFYLGWRATLNGRDVPIERANYLFRAVALPPGEHVVAFRFEPTVVYVGGMISAVAWLVLLGLIVAGLRRERAKPCGASRVPNSIRPSC